MSANRCDANAFRANRNAKRRADPGVLRSGENDSFSFRSAHDREPSHDLVHCQFEHVERADEVRDERRSRMLVDLARAAYLLDLTAVHDRDAVGHRKRLVLVVGDVHERRSQLGLDPLQLELHLLAQLHVQRTQRFVEQQCGRLVDERSGQRHALLLAAGKLPRAPVLEPLELDDPQDLEYPPPVFLPRDALHLEPERDVVVDRHVREERVLLEHHVDGSSVREDRRDVPSLKDHTPLVRHFEPGDHPQRRRLSASARAEEREELPLADRERHVAHRIGLSEALADVLERDRNAGVFRHPGPSLTRRFRAEAAR